MTDDAPKINEWLRNLYTEMIRDRFQGAVRAQTRYLFLLLLISAYTFAAHFTPGDVVEVPFLGLKAPRPLIEAFAVSTLGVLLLALFGTEEMLKRLIEILPGALNVKRVHPELVEAEPNALDFVAYCTYLNGDPTRLTPIGWLVLYPLPLIAFLAWAISLWWAGVHHYLSAWPWLVIVHVVNAVILLVALVRLIMFVWSIWRRIKALPPIRRESTEL